MLHAPPTPELLDQLAPDPHTPDTHAPDPQYQARPDPPRSQSTREAYGWAGEGVQVSELRRAS